MRKMLRYLVTAAMLLAAMSTAAFAVEDVVLTEEVSGTIELYQNGDFPESTFDPYGAMLLTEEPSNAEIAKQAIYEQLLAEKEFVDITLQNHSLGAVIGDLYMEVINENPELYHLYGLNEGSYTTTNTIHLVPLYKTELLGKRDVFNAAVEKALAAVEGMTDPLDIALALHDYLALNCEYNWVIGNASWIAENYGQVVETYGTEPVFSAYGALVDQDAVCQGYALAYQYLLGLNNIKSGLVTSDAINHAWNWVLLDGEYYHVDVTWDDGTFATMDDGPGSDLPGYCGHEFFMQDTETFWNHERSRHYGFEDQPIYQLAADTTYTSGWLFNYTNTIYYENGKYYYGDGVNVSVADDLQAEEFVSNHFTAIRIGDVIFYTIRYSTGNTVVWRYDIGKNFNAKVIDVLPENDPFFVGLAAHADGVEVLKVTGYQTHGQQGVYPVYKTYSNPELEGKIAFAAIYDDENRMLWLEAADTEVNFPTVSDAYTAKVIALQDQTWLPLLDAVITPDITPYN